MAVIGNNSKEMTYFLLNKYIREWGWVGAKQPNNMVTKGGFFFHTFVVGAYSEDYSDPPLHQKKKKKNQITISKTICQLSK